MMRDSYNYRSTWHAISSIIAQRGLRGMLKGYWAGNSVGLCRDCLAAVHHLQRNLCCAYKAGCRLGCR